MSIANGEKHYTLLLDVSFGPQQTRGYSAHTTPSRYMSLSVESELLAAPNHYFLTNCAEFNVFFYL